MNKNPFNYLLRPFAGLGFLARYRESVKTEMPCGAAHSPASQHVIGMPLAIRQLFVPMFAVAISVSGCADMPSGPHAGKGGATFTASSRAAPASADQKTAPAQSSRPFNGPVTIKAKDSPAPDVDIEARTDPIDVNEEPMPGPSELTATDMVNSAWHGVLSVGYVYGGSVLANVQYPDGSTGQLGGGSGAQVSAGLMVRFSKPLSVQVTAGYLSDAANYNDSSIRFDRYPLEAIVDVNLTDNLKVGAGIQRIFSPNIIGAQQLGLPLQFNDANGAVFEAEYMVTPALSVKLRSVSEKLTANGFTGSLSGNQFGLFTTIYFGN
jgi:hypothetical protein